MTIPHRGWTSNSTYFITASCWEKQRLLQSARMAELFLEALYHYRKQQKYLLHEFVVMPNHFHLLLTPGETLERAMQLIKGGFSFHARKELGLGGEIWQTSFYDHRVRDFDEHGKMKTYIRQNPVRAGLVERAEVWPYSSANPRVSVGRSTSAAKAAEHQGEVGRGGRLAVSRGKSPPQIQ